MFSLLNSGVIYGGSKKYKLPPPLKSVAAVLYKSECSKMPLYSTANSGQSDAKTFNYSKCSQGINLPLVLEMPAFIMPCP